jgi:TonB family protein
MAWALGLLLVTLGVVLYADRDFWFPEPQENTARNVPTVQPAQSSQSGPETVPASANKRGHRENRGARNREAPKPTQSVEVPTSPVSISRTALPPLEVEVVAGDNHKNVRPGSNSLKVDLEPGTKSQIAEPASTENVVTNAGERSDVSSNPGDVVSHSVQPGYPLLARQMKVQGAVVLLALIGRDGLIQNLSILSGPPILAKAAREAVSQWHFKPHYQGAEPVETQAKITVNFTISTN